MAKLPPVEEIVEGWFSRSMTPAETPNQAYDHPIKRVDKSIMLTLKYLAATRIPYTKGHPHLVRDLDGNTTLFWPIYYINEVNQGAIPKTSLRVHSKTTIYGFDAAGAIVVEVIGGTEITKTSTRINEFFWPSWYEIPEEQRTKFLKKLQSFRKKLI